MPTDKLTVIKRDGTKEPFQSEKIKKVSMAAGLADDEADKVSKAVAEALVQTGKSEVNSVEIRDLLLPELEKVDVYAAGLFAWYQNEKNKDGKD